MKGPNPDVVDILNWRGWTFRIEGGPFDWEAEFDGFGSGSVADFGDFSDDEGAPTAKVNIAGEKNARRYGQIDEVQHQKKVPRLGKHEHHQRGYATRPVTTAARHRATEPTASTAAAAAITCSERAIKPLRKGRKNDGRTRKLSNPIGVLFSQPTYYVLAWISKQVV